MREISFRALAIKKGKSGDLDGDSVWFYDVYTDGSGVLIDTKYQGIKPLKCVEALCQSTGLKDIDGKMIFEGDIISRDNGVGFINVEVIWNEDRCGFELHKRYDNFWYDFDCDNIIDFNLKIIGNVHEHKHLMETK